MRSHISADVSFQVSAHNPAVMRCSLSPSAESEVFREPCQVKRIRAVVGHCLINHPVWQETVWMLTQVAVSVPEYVLSLLLSASNRKKMKHSKALLVCLCTELMSKTVTLNGS